MDAEILGADRAPDSARLLVAGLPLRWLPVFFLIIPLAVGLNQGWLQAGLARYLPPTQAILLWCGNWLLYWWACEVLTRVAAAVLRPWQLAPAIVVIFGGVLATLLSPLYFGAFSVLFVDYLPPHMQVAEAHDMRRLFDPTFTGKLLASGAGGMLLWVLANLFFESYLRWPRFRSLGLMTDGGRDPLPMHRDPLPGIPATSISAVPTPGILLRLAKLERPTTDTLFAIEAQEHYVKVHTARGTELVYYRFGDAIRDLQGWNGLQVHRSWWVSRPAILRVNHEGRRLKLVLCNDLQIPVGSSFTALVRQAGVADISRA
jgi:hypothetical protein